MAEGDGSAPGVAAPTPSAAPPAAAPAPTSASGALAPPPPAGPLPGPDWAAGFEPEAQGFVQAKGWTQPGDMLKSYRALESVQGVPEDQLVKIPGNPDDPTAMGDFYAKLGRPAEAAAYDFGVQAPVAEGEVDITPDFRSWAHNSGLTQRQAKGIFDNYQAKAAEFEATQQEQRGLQAENDMAALRTQWGQGYDAKIQAGQRFVARFGLGEQLDQLESAMGTKGMLEFAARVGEAMGEHAGPTVDPTTQQGTQFGITPEHAKAKIIELKNDEAFQKRLFETGDPDAKTHWRMLHEAAFPGQVESPIVTATQRP